MERHQVALYLCALAFGAAVGLLAPSAAPAAETLITPALGLLLYATFLGIPFARVGQAVRDWRFLTTALALNFLVAPAVVWLLSRVIAHDRGLLLGVLLVLLTPCVDYVIVFAGLAGGAKDRLLAATPLLMLTQMLLLPLYLRLFVGPGLTESIDPSPFVEAFLFLIAMPLIAASLTQFVARRTRWAARLQVAAVGSMVPLMMLVLATVVASQISGVGRQLGSLLLAVPIYVLFAVVMIPLGIAASRIARLDAPAGRAITFSGVTRNSLVVLPLALALPHGYELAPLVVVTQTLVELVIMVICVRLLPRLIPNRR
ncbi:MAG: arsenic resistance protein [Leucobacter sp.]